MHLISSLNILRRSAGHLSVIAFIALTLTACSSARRDRPISESDFQSPIRVACVGDSITYGAGIPDREHNSYPAQLAALLGPRWDVRNFGVSGSTLLKKGNKPYWQQSAFRDALAFQPDVVIIKLGTNDSKPDNWRHKNEFLADCEALIQEFRTLESRPRIYLCRPVPAFPERWGIRDEVIHNEIIPLLDRAAEETETPVIDLYSALSGKSEMFPDQIHPDARGAGLIASTLFTALTGREAGFAQ